MSNISSLSDLRKKQAKEAEGKQNEYYAGGVDNRSGGGSGLAVVGPPDERNRGGPPMPAGGSRGNIFDDLVHRATNASQEPAPAGGAAGTTEFRITLYRNGFTVNDGPLRDPMTPENQLFMARLMEGRVPEEIMEKVGSRVDELDVQLVDKREEDYVAPAYVAFSGTGSTLGATVAEGAAVFTAAELAGVNTTVDETQPVVTIQTRTSAGKRLRLRVNAQFTVRQLAALILAQNPGATRFTLGVGFPPVDLQNSAATVSDAVPANDLVTQKTA